MTHWVTSDTHWGHKRILEYCPTTRPYTSVEEHDEALIEAWNSRVRPNDTVYHLGDFAFLPEEDIHAILRRLNGQVILVLGNHDRINRFVTAPKIVGLHNYLEIKVGRKPVILFHFPIQSWNKCHYGSIHLHGHTHGALNDEQPANRFDVGVDSHSENAPFNLEEIVTT